MNDHTPPPFPTIGTRRLLRSSAIEPSRAIEVPGP
jgi:hypothetical protein